MPFIYAKSKTKACRQCKYYLQGEGCQAPLSPTLTLIAHLRRIKNTYSCDGFVSNTGQPDKFSTYYNGKD